MFVIFTICSRHTLLITLQVTCCVVHTEINYWKLYASAFHDGGRDYVPRRDIHAHRREMHTKGTRVPEPQTHTWRLRKTLRGAGGLLLDEGVFGGVSSSWRTVRRTKLDNSQKSYLLLPRGFRNQFLGRVMKERNDLHHTDGLGQGAHKVVFRKPVLLQKILANDFRDFQCAFLVLGQGILAWET